MKLKFLEVFKVGEHPISETKSLNFSEEMLKASIAAYDPKLHEAPLVIGHPKNDDPAYGWVKNAKLIDGRFVTENDQVNTEFAELVESGAFKKISASFYPIGSKYNPVPEVLYLKHIGFLGAKPPAIKGLAGTQCQHSFAEDEELVTIEFSEINFMDWDDLTVAGLFSNLREWMISKFNLETADQVIPIYAIDGLKMSAVKDDIKPEMPMDYSEGDKPVTIDFAEKEAALDAREADIAKREQALKEHEFAEWFDSLGGKAYPHERQKAIATLMKLSSESEVVEFAEGNETKSLSLVEAYKQSFENRSTLIEFAELPQGVDPIDLNDGEEVGLKAKEYMNSEAAKGNKIDAIAAVKHVTGKK